MEEKADRRVRQPLANEPGDQHELVVVHPDEVPLAVLRSHRRRELLVHRPVDLPVLGVDRDAIELVVEERPEDAVRKRVVIAFELVLIELHGDGAGLGEPGIQRSALLVAHLRRIARPTDPQALGALVVGAKARRQPPGARHDVHAVLPCLDRERKAIGNDEEALHGAPAGPTSRARRGRWSPRSGWRISGASSGDSDGRARMAATTCGVLARRSRARCPVRWALSLRWRRRTRAAQGFTNSRT